MRIYKQDREGRRIEVSFDDATRNLTENKIIDIIDKLRCNSSVCCTDGVEFLIFER